MHLRSERGLGTTEILTLILGASILVFTVLPIVKQKVQGGASGILGSARAGSAASTSMPEESALVNVQAGNIDQGGTGEGEEGESTPLPDDDVHEYWNTMGQPDTLFRDFLGAVGACPEPCASMLVETRGSATSEDEQLVEAYLTTHLPPKVLEQIFHHGTRIIVARDSIADWKRELTGKNPGAGFAHDATYEKDVGGKFLYGTDEVVIFTRDNPDGSRDMGEVEWSLLHELGHSFEDGQSERSEEFIAARNADYDALRPYVRDQERGHPDQHGLSETFADSFKAFYSDPEMATKMPHLYAFMKKWDLEQKGEEGGRELSEIFADSYAFVKKWVSRAPASE